MYRLREMTRLWHRSGLMALLAILVMSPLTLADTSADRNGTATGATSIEDEPNQSNQTGASPPGLIVAVNTSIKQSSLLPVADSTSKTAPNQKATVSHTIKPSPVLEVPVSTFSKQFFESEYPDVRNTGLDYDLTDIFGEDAVFDFPPGSPSSTYLVTSPVVDLKKTQGSNDHRSSADHSITLPGHAPLAGYGKSLLDSSSTKDKLEAPYIVHYLPDGEPFHTPPPLNDDALAETNSEDHFEVAESPYQSNRPYFLPGRSIPKVVNKPGSPDVGYTNSLSPVDHTPVSQRPSNNPLNVQTEHISVTILNTPNGSLQVGAPQRLDYDALPHSDAPLNSTYGALLPVVAPVSSTFGGPPQASAPLSSSYIALPQTGTLSFTYGAPPQASALLSFNNGVAFPASAPLSFAYGAPPQANASLNSANRALPQAGALPPTGTISSTYGTPPHASAPLSSTYGAPSQASYAYEMPRAEVKDEEPYSGFLSTLWKTGSAREAAAGYASDLWNKFTKGVGTEAAKKSKIILFKAAPLIKKVIGAKSVENLLQKAHAGAHEINGVSAPAATVVGESRVPLAAYWAPPTVLDQVIPEAPLPSYQAIHPDLQPARGAPPGILAVSTTSRPVVANKPEDSVQPLPLASGQTAKYRVEETAKEVAPSPPTKYYLSEPIKYYIHAPEQPDVVLQGPTISVGETRQVDPAHQHHYPAVPLPEYNPLSQYGPPSVLPKAAQPSVLNFHTPQAQEVQNYPYLPPQASHLIRNQGDEQQAIESVTTLPRPGIFAIVDKAREGYNTVYNTIEYGRNLTDRAATALGGFWPGNWFRSTNSASQLGESPAAPAAISIVSSYAPPVVVPVSNPDRPFYYPPNYQYPGNYEAAQYPGYVVNSDFNGQQGPVAHSYIAALSGPVVQEEVGEPNHF